LANGKAKSLQINVPMLLDAPKLGALDQDLRNLSQFLDSQLSIPLPLPNARGIRQESDNMEPNSEFLASTGRAFVAAAGKEVSNRNPERGWSPAQQVQWCVVQGCPCESNP